jgi:O-antigen/teichoic acid export membrane protein
VIGVSVLTDRIVAILYKEEFAEAGPILRVLIWVLLLEFLNPFLSHVLFAQGKQHRSMVVAAISLSVNSIATYLLVRQFGAIGAAAGCILGGLVATICYLAFSAKMSELPGIVASMARVLIAASGMGLAVYLVRDSSWPIVIVVATAVYVALLFLVQAVRMSDVRFFKSTFLSRAPA